MISVAFAVAGCYFVSRGYILMFPVVTEYYLPDFKPCVNKTSAVRVFTFFQELCNLRKSRIV